MNVRPWLRHSLKPDGGVAPQIAAPPVAPIRPHRAVQLPLGNPPTEPVALDRLHFADTPLGTLQPRTVMSVVRSVCGLASNVTLEVSHASPALGPVAGTHMPTSSPLMSAQVKPLAQVQPAKLGSPWPQCAP